LSVNIETLWNGAKCYVDFHKEHICPLTSILLSMIMVKALWNKHFRFILINNAGLKKGILTPTGSNERHRTQHEKTSKIMFNKIIDLNFRENFILTSVIYRITRCKYFMRDNKDMNTVTRSGFHIRNKSSVKVIVASSAY